ncbi:MAG: diaminopimelate decarboxylase [Polyangiaceae bacterium]
MSPVPTLVRDAQGRAVLGGVLLEDVLRARGVTTPAYVYDVDAIVAEARALKAGYGDHDHLVCYAVKANTAGRIIRRLAEAGVGADVVSGGELEVAVGAGVSPDRIVWSGVAKTDRELDRAITIGERGIYAIQAESIEELDRIGARAKALGRTARVSVRINPGIEADTHAHIATGHDEAKFGIPIADASIAFDRLRSLAGLQLVGASCHVGSQLTDTRDYAAGAEVLARLAVDWRERGAKLEYIDFGGGFGIDYGNGCEVQPSDFARLSRDVALKMGLGDLRLLSEPGRSLVAAHGALVASVIQSKRAHLGSRDARWLMIDAGMNDLLRPALYQARHRIEPLTLSNASQTTWRVAGPICESSDDFGDYELPIDAPSHVVIRDTGAYGFTMASEYNGRGMPCEVFLEAGEISSVSAGHDVYRWVRARLST